MNKIILAVAVALTLSGCESMDFGGQPLTQEQVNLISVMNQNRHVLVPYEMKPTNTVRPINCQSIRNGNIVNTNCY